MKAMKPMQKGVPVRVGRSKEGPVFYRCDGFNLACTTKLDACTIVARGIMICVLCCMHDMSFAEGIATAVVNPRSCVAMIEFSVGTGPTPKIAP